MFIVLFVVMLSICSIMKVAVKAFKYGKLTQRERIDLRRAFSARGDAYIYMCIYVYIYIYTHCVHIYIYIYTYVYKYTYIHTYIHTYVHIAIFGVLTLSLFASCLLFESPCAALRHVCSLPQHTTLSYDIVQQL